MLLKFYGLILALTSLTFLVQPTLSTSLHVIEANDLSRRGVNTPSGKDKDIIEGRELSGRGLKTRNDIGYVNGKSDESPRKPALKNNLNTSKPHSKREESRIKPAPKHSPFGHGKRNERGIKPAQKNSPLGEHHVNKPHGKRDERMQDRDVSASGNVKALKE